MKFYPIILTLIIAVFCLNSPAFSKSDEAWKGFAKAAEEYEATAEKYEKMAEELSSTAPEKAAIYKKVAKNYEDMADIKDDAARNAKRGYGKKVDWEDYEELAKENKEYLKLLGDSGDSKSKKPSDKDYTAKDKHVAEGDEATKQKIKELEQQLELEREKLKKK